MNDTPNSMLHGLTLAQLLAIEGFHAGRIMRRALNEEPHKMLHVTEEQQAHHLKEQAERKAGLVKRIEAWRDREGPFADGVRLGVEAPAVEGE